MLSSALYFFLNLSFLVLLSRGGVSWHIRECLSALNVCSVSYRNVKEKRARKRMDDKSWSMCLMTSRVTDRALCVCVCGPIFYEVFCWSALSLCSGHLFVPSALRTVEFVVYRLQIFIRQLSIRRPPSSTRRSANIGRKCTLKHVLALVQYPNRCS